MKHLKRIWKDITHGEHIIDYVLILVAFSLPILNLLGVVTTDRLIFATLPILGLLVVKAVAQSWEEGTDIRIHENWTGEVYEAFAKAKRSIVVLTSWVVDSSILADKIREACKRTNKMLTVDIYMLDPDEPFGAQRYGEVNEYGRPRSKKWQIKYQTGFEESVDYFRNRLGDMPNVSLNIYKYGSMPTVKICIVDDETFFFGWLPVKYPSTQNVCVELSTKSRNQEVLHTIDRLKQHINDLAKTRILVPPLSHTDEVPLLDKNHEKGIEAESKSLAEAEV